MSRNVWFLLLFFALFIVSGCTSIEEMHAQGASWKTTQTLFEYKSVVTGSIDIGGISFPLTGEEWRVINSATNTGTDANPIVPSEFDCGYDIPTYPDVGDWYCDQKIEYFLLFDGKEVEVSQEVWSEYSPYNIYKVEKGFGTYRLVGS